MSCKLVSILYLLLVCSLVSADENVPSKETAVNASMSAVALQNVPPQYADKQQEQQEVPVGAKMEGEMLDISNVKPVQVTGFITASGSIFEVDDKRSVGVIEARQNGQLLSPQPSEFICNYGSVVVYSDRPCEDVMSIEKQEKNKDKKNTPNKSVKTETDKQTDQKQKETVVSEQTQADDSSDVATAMGTKDEQLDEEEPKPMAQKKQKKNKKKKKKSNKNKKKSKKTNKRKPSGAQRIRVKTKIIKRRPTLEQQLNQPLRRPQSNRRPRPRPRPQQQKQQSQRRLQNRRFAQFQSHGGLYTTSGGKIYELVEVAN